MTFDLLGLFALLWYALILAFTPDILLADAYCWTTCDTFLEGTLTGEFPVLKKLLLVPICFDWSFEDDCWWEDSWVDNLTVPTNALGGLLVLGLPLDTNETIADWIPPALVVWKTGGSSNPLISK